MDSSRDMRTPILKISRASLVRRLYPEPRINATAISGTFSILFIYDVCDEVVLQELRRILNPPTAKGASLSATSTCSGASSSDAIRP
jgi:hypothetical protein